VSAKTTCGKHADAQKNRTPFLYPIQLEKVTGGSKQFYTWSAMPRAPKLSKVNGYWRTKAGDESGVYFGKVGEVPFKEANREFRKYLATLAVDRKRITLPQLSVAEICENHLAWVESHRSPSLFRQRRSILNYWCNHIVQTHNGRRLPGNAQQIGRLRATVITRPYVEQHIEHRAANPSRHTVTTPPAFAPG
jgi:hypothetical protein